MFQKMDGLLMKPRCWFQRQEFGLFVELFWVPPLLCETQNQNGMVMKTQNSLELLEVNQSGMEMRFQVLDYSWDFLEVNY